MEAFLCALKRLVEALGPQDAFQRALLIVTGEWPASYDSEVRDTYSLLQPNEQMQVQLALTTVGIQDVVSLQDYVLTQPYYPDWKEEQ